MKLHLQFIKARWFLFGAGLILGSLVVLGIRFFRYHPESVHYHANFAVYMNGQREAFNGPRFYEETGATSCSISMEKADSPKERAHMHGGINDLIHVHDHLVTWGNFFQLLNWGLGDDYLKTTDKIYTPDDQHKLSFMLNGTKVDSISNVVIEDEDKLLISYGDGSSEELAAQYKTIASTAHEYDIGKDPASCSGSKPITWSDRLKHLF